MTELSRELVSFAWTATSGYKHYPPYVNLTGNRLTVRGAERDGAIADQYFIEPGPYAFVDLPPEALNELRAALNASTLADENAALKHDLIRAMDGRNAEMNARIEAEAENATLRIDCEFLLSVIDSCDEAEAPSCEMEPEDVANIDRIRTALSHKETNNG